MRAVLFGMLLCLVMVVGCGDDDGGAAGSGATSGGTGATGGSGGSGGAGGTDDDSGVAGSGATGGDGGTSGAGGTGGDGGTSGAGGTGGDGGASGAGGTGGDGGTGGTSVSGCTGTPAASVATACAGFSVGMQCSPVAGCRASGSCEATRSQNDCVLRGVMACGDQFGTGKCYVDPGDNFPATAVCVQSESPKKCTSPTLNLEGSCINFTDNGAAETGICTWVDGDTPTCIAAECAGYPVQQFCEMIPGCTWNP